MASKSVDLRSNWKQLLEEHAISCAGPHPANTFPPQRVLQLHELVARISYREGWHTVIIEERGIPSLQIQTLMRDSSSGLMIENNSRSITLCPLMPDVFLIDLAFELIKEFELHEAAEHFRVDDKAIYHPHDHNGRPLRILPAFRSTCLS